MQKHQKQDAYVLVHYPGATRLQTFVQQVRLLEPDVPLCIVDPNLDELPKELQLDRDVHFIRGSLLSRDTYYRANVQAARTVIIFPRPDQGSEADATTKTIVEIIEEYFDREELRVICILADQQNEWMFARTTAKLIQGDLEILALVQECQDRHASTAVQELLANERGANPVTVTPSAIVGSTWGEVCTRLLDLEREGSALVRPFALVRGLTIEHCPAWNLRIESSDRLILVSADQLDWAAFEQRLKA